MTTDYQPTAAELEEAVRSEIRAELRDMSTEQAGARLAELSRFARPTNRQKIEREMLVDQANRASRIMAMIVDGTISNVTDGPRDMTTGQPLPPPSTPGRPQSQPATPLYDRARRTLDGLHGRGLPDHATAVVDRLIRAPQGAGEQMDGSRTLAQRWLEVAGSPEYERAFAALVRDPITGGAELDERERAAWRAGRQIQNALGDATGGGQFMLPVVIDPAIHLSNAGSRNVLRQIARVEQMTTNQWLGVASAGATAEWVAEAAQVADGSPTLTQPAVIAYKGDSFVPVSFEWFDDAQNGMAELQSILIDAASLLQNTAYTVGTGTAQPFGVVTSGTSLTQSPTGAFAAAHITQVQNALPPRFSANASWCANIAVINTAALFQTANGALVYPEMRNTPSTLLRKPLYEVSDMTADMATASSRYLLYGDFSQFLICDRIGSTFEIVQNLVGAAFRPTGQRGALLWFRTGSAVLVPAAFRVLVKA